MNKNRVLMVIIVALAIAPAHATPLSTNPCSVSPGNPTTNDVVSLMFSGVWTDSCKPNSHQVSFLGNTIYVDIYATYNPPICQQALSAWSRTAQVGPLADGDYQVIGRIHDETNHLTLVPPCSFTVISADSLYIIGAASRKLHGVAGNFDMPVPIGVNSFVESRSGGPTTIVVSFNKNIADYSGQPAVASVGSVTNAEVQGNQLIVSLEGVPDRSCLTLILDVTDESYSYLIEGINHVDLRVLFGDATQNGTVNTTDMSKSKSVVSQTLTTANALCDFNLSGTLNTTDMAAVKSAIGHSTNCP